MLVGASLLLFWAGKPLGRREAIFLLTPIMVFLVVLSRSGFNLGLRHVLPIYPFLFLLAARLATIRIGPAWVTALLLGIPVGAKNKRAAWAFITWAMSKETLRRITVEKGYTTVCRRSIIDDPAYRRAMTFNGQDVAELYLKVLNLGGKSGYMKYRTVPVFPQVGDKINKAIERIATKQQSARDAMKQAQAEAIEDLKKAGVKLDA